MNAHRKIARDVAWQAFRNGEWRLALAVLIWPPGWSHTRLGTNEANLADRTFTCSILCRIVARLERRDDQRGALRWGNPDRSTHVETQQEERDLRLFGTHIRWAISVIKRLRTKEP